MALQISTFRNLAILDGRVSPFVQGPPIRVTANSFTGAFTVGADENLIRIKGTGTITWPTDADPEDFAGIEIRAVPPGTQFTVA